MGLGRIGSEVVQLLATVAVPDVDPLLGHEGLEGTEGGRDVGARPEFLTNSSYNIDVVASE